jgi:hypothetical protein
VVDFKGFIHLKEQAQQYAYGACNKDGCISGHAFLILALDCQLECITFCAPDLFMPAHGEVSFAREPCARKLLVNQPGRLFEEGLA